MTKLNLEAGCRMSSTMLMLEALLLHRLQSVEVSSLSSSLPLPLLLPFPSSSLSSSSSSSEEEEEDSRFSSIFRLVFSAFFRFSARLSPVFSLFLKLGLMYLLTVSALAAACNAGESFFIFMRRFWNQILICLSLRPNCAANSNRLGLQRYLQKNPRKLTRLLAIQ